MTQNDGINFGPATDWAEDCMACYGQILLGKYAHFCYEFDGLPIDETCREFLCCKCYDEEVNE